MSQTAFEIAGVSPVQLPLGDVYTALQTRLVDTVAGPPMGAIALQWHTNMKYLTDVPLTYLIGVFAIDRKAFDKLRPDDSGSSGESSGRRRRGWMPSTAREKRTPGPRCESRASSSSRRPRQQRWSVGTG